MTCSRAPCHLQEAPGQGHEYGLYSQPSSCSPLSVCNIVTRQPEAENLQGKRTVLATFSMARLRMLPNGPLQVGQHVNLGLQFEHTKCPLGH